MLSFQQLQDGSCFYVPSINSQVFNQYLLWRNACFSFMREHHTLPSSHMFFSLATHIWLLWKSFSFYSTIITSYLLLDILLISRRNMVIGTWKINNLFLNFKFFLPILALALNTWKKYCNNNITAHCKSCKFPRKLLKL